MDGFGPLARLFMPNVRDDTRDCDASAMISLRSRFCPDTTGDPQGDAFTPLLGCGEPVCFCGVMGTGRAVGLSVLVPPNPNEPSNDPGEWAVLNRLDAGVAVAADGTSSTSAKLTASLPLRIGVAEAAGSSSIWNIKSFIDCLLLREGPSFAGFSSCGTGLAFFSRSLSCSSSWSSRLRSRIESTRLCRSLSIKDTNSGYFSYKNSSVLRPRETG